MQEVAPGAVLKVRACTAPESAPWTEIEIRGCRPAHKDAWEVHCQFLQTPNWAVLMLFG